MTKLQRNEQKMCLVGIVTEDSSLLFTVFRILMQINCMPKGSPVDFLPTITANLIAMSFYFIKSLKD